MSVLNIACGNTPIEGAVNHDRTLFAPYVAIAFDLNVLPWPIADDTYDALIAHSIVEHLNSFYDFFNEAHRILRSRGTIDVIVPYYDHINVAIDPTHKRGYVVESFHFLDPDTKWGKKAHMYSDKHWKIIELHEINTFGKPSDIHAKLEVRK
jgi:SAM-dependent methyltransferase